MPFSIDFVIHSDQESDPGRLSGWGPAWGRLAVSPPVSAEPHYLWTLSLLVWRNSPNQKSRHISELSQDPLHSLSARMMWSSLSPAVLTAEPKISSKIMKHEAQLGEETCLRTHYTHWQPGCDRRCHLWCSLLRKSQKCIQTQSGKWIMGFIWSYQIWII